MAEGLLRLELVAAGMQSKVAVDSAGTHASQPGVRADPRAQRVCTNEGVNLKKIRARQFRERDFKRFDYILCMDRKNLDWFSSENTRQTAAREFIGDGIDESAGNIEVEHGSIHGLFA